MAKRKPNLILIGIDSLRADHMSLYGYPRLTTPHIDQFAWERHRLRAELQPPHPDHLRLRRHAHRPRLLRHQHRGAAPPGPDGRGRAHAGRDPPRRAATTTTCVGFKGNPASRGFDNYLDFSGWGSWKEGRSPKAENLNAVAIPELNRLAAGKKPFFLFLRHMDPHAPYLPPAPFERMFYDGNECDPDEQVDGAGLRPSSPSATSSPPGCRRASPTRTTSSPSTTARSPTWTPASRPSSPPDQRPGPGRGHARRHQQRPRRDALRPRLLLRPPRHLRPDAARAADLPHAGPRAGGPAPGRLHDAHRT